MTPAWRLRIAFIAVVATGLAVCALISTRAELISDGRGALVFASGVATGLLFRKGR